MSIPVRLKIFFLLLFGLVFPGCQNLFCQRQHTGFKYVKNYSSGNHPQNWSILQDIRGIIYVANNGRLLEFDGVSWREIDVPNDTIRSLAMDDYGTVYLGGINEFGYLAPDAKGELQYVSLMEHVPDEQKNFSTVWRVNAAKKGVYFRTHEYLFRWNPDAIQIKVWKPKKQFNASFFCNGILFIHQRDIGLMQMVNDSLQMIPGNETFASVRIYMMVPYDNHSILIGTRSKGLFIYDYRNKNTRPFPTGVDDYLLEKELYHGILLKSTPGGFALATLWGGLAVIDSFGKLKHIFDKTSGLQDDKVYFVYEDFQGNLWLALDIGISKIEYASPISIYDSKLANLHGNVLSVVRHDNDLYVGTSSGLYLLKPSSNGQFHQVPGIKGMCLSILSIGDSLLAATENGVYQVEIKNKNKNINYSKRLVIKNRSYFLLRSKQIPNRIWVGTYQELVSLYSTNKNGPWTWVEEHKLKNTHGQIKTIVEDRNGNLWLGTRTNGVLKIDFPIRETKTDQGVNAAVTRYDESHGLPSRKVHVFAAAEHIIFATDKGIFRFDEKSNVFIPDSTLGPEFAGESRGVYRIVEDNNKNIWFHSESRNFQATPKPNGTFTIYSNPFLRIPLSQVNFIYTDPGGDITWFAGNDALIRYDTTIKKKYRRDFSTLVRKVLVNGQPIFLGYKYQTGKESKEKHLFPVIPYKDRNLQFEFAAPCFENESATRYRCFLKGYDKGWSEWKSESKKDYTNLDSGSYLFRVQARDVYHNPGREDVFQFKVLPPWYKTWWAILGYTFGLLLLMFLVVNWRSRKLRKEKQRLENIIKQRTKEINQKNQQLEDQSEKLKEMDKVKSQFFANISHEFRTPLTLIMAPLEQMNSDCPENDKTQKKKLNLMLRNSQRLLSLINQLLELSKLESGKMKLKASQQDIVLFIKGIAASFDLVAQQREQDLTFRSDEEEIMLYFDPGKMEEVICNLVSNAVKFTPAGGRIAIEIKKITSNHKENFPSSSVEITVSDTGPGIPREQLIHIFDRFYQVESTYEHHLKGSGIGLSIAKDLVELHHGSIDVHNREGEPSGTQFIICLPLGDAHLEPGEIIEVSEAPTAGKLASEIPGFDQILTEEENEESRLSQTNSAGKDIILVAEDSADVREYIRGSLEPLYTVIDAANGQEGIQKAREMIPDLVISDIMMPQVDGYQLCRELKSNIKTSHIPVILLTAKASDGDIIQGLETGADDYITKPFNTRVLCARIKNLIDLRRQVQQKIQRQMTLKPVKIAVSQMDEEFIKQLEEVIEKNLSDTEFNVDLLCKKLYMSRTTIYRKVLALTGEPPTEFIRSYRLKRGVELIKSNFGSITEIAFEVGFSSSAYFTKCFKDKFHQLPSSFQEPGSPSS